MALSVQAPLFAGETSKTIVSQDTLRAPPVWWFGAAAGLNLNLYWGTTQELNSGFTTPTAFHKGIGAGLYLAPLIEYRPDPVWGGILQIGYDDRRGSFYDVKCPCGQNATLTARPSYISVEPSLRVAPFSNDFYLFAGPRVAFAASFTGDEKAFVYTQEGIASTKADFSSMHNVVYSGQFGMGYDIKLAPANARTQADLAPFISYQPHFGQQVRSSENWTMSTLRIGVALKFGRGKIVSVNGFPEVRFSAHTPKAINGARRIRETFPLRNYVFFDSGSSEIPGRYVVLTKEQAAGFKEEQLQEVQPKSFEGRSLRQMTVYHNILNTLGDRMKRNPTITLTLSGASNLGSDQGKARAETIKTYLVNVFGIDGSRITTEGRDKPLIPSEQPGGTKQLDLLQAGDNRVDITSDSPEMLVQVGGGSQFMLKPVQIVAFEDESDSVMFNAIGANESFTSWSLEVTDSDDVVQHFGPYTEDRAALMGNDLLGNRTSGNYSIVMVGQQKNGNLIRKETSIHLVHKIEGIKETVRFAILFDFNQSQTVASYDKFLTEVVSPMISDSSIVAIRGYTDTVGDTAHNYQLSRERAQGTQNILDTAIAKSGKQGVMFQTNWYGQDPQQAPFDNTFPEERFYNRTVIIDIIPK